jgi:hypothetical protein
MVVSVVLPHDSPFTSRPNRWLTHYLTYSLPPRSRIDRRSEYDRFISDVTRLVEEISANQTFHSVSPLLNFWAAFTPSEEVRSADPIIAND